MKKIFTILLTISLSLMSLHAEGKNGYKKQKVVYHINYDNQNNKKVLL